MDRTDSRQARAGSQSKIPRILFWIVAAAIAFRIVTALADRSKRADSGAGLVVWQPHETAAAAAGKQRKPVLYDFTAEWCAPCHRLDSEGWTDGKIAALINEKYIAARVMDRQREDGKNPASIEELEHRYSISAFPTLIVADASGREIARAEGYGGKDRLAAFLEDARKKAAP
jgi:thiol:disulfide interchange protein